MHQRSARSERAVSAVREDSARRRRRGAACCAGVLMLSGWLVLPALWPASAVRQGMALDRCCLGWNGSSRLA